MRESRTYGSGGGRAMKRHVPTATQTPRVHHAARRRGGRVAARGARAAARRCRWIGFLMTGSLESPAASRAIVAAFRQRLRERGYLEGQNIDIEYRWAEGDDRSTSRDLRGIELRFVARWT